MTAAHAAARGLAPEPFIYAPELAARLGVPLDSVRRAARLGTLPHYRVPALSGTRPRVAFRWSEVESMIESVPAGATA